MDTLSKKDRSKRMGLVRAQNTKPEMLVRKLISGLGFRYRLHTKDIPGTPDIVFRSRRKLIFVHGCFWHRHPNCSNNRMPKSRIEFWKTKLERNRKRDLEQQARLKKTGWKFLIVWECETRDKELLRRRIEGFLNEA